MTALGSDGAASTTTCSFAELSRLSERGRQRAPGAQIPGSPAARASWCCRPEPWPGPALEPVTVDEIKPLLVLPLAGRSSTLFYFAELPVNVPNTVR